MKKNNCVQFLAIQNWQYKTGNTKQRPNVTLAPTCVNRGEKNIFYAWYGSMMYDL